MRGTIPILTVVTAFAVSACSRGEPEPEAVEVPTTTAGMEELDDAQAMEDRARHQREQLAEPSPQYGGTEPDPMEPETYGEMLREPGELEPQYGATQPPLGGSTPPPGYGEVPMDEASMAARIEEALSAAPMLEDDAITVRVEGSRVHLAGLVDSPTEINAARDIASSIPGVQEVIVEQLRVITQR